MKLFHFSEDPAIERFEPHVPATQPDAPPMVWAIDAEHAPTYWFPRNCPRAAFWPKEEPTPTQLALLGGRRRRVHAIEWAWLERMRTCALYAYELDPEPFQRRPQSGGAWTSTVAVEPLRVSPVGDLLARHHEARIELRLVDNLWPLWELVTSSGLPFSGVRLRNAAAPPANYRGPLPQ